jgi:hypothetical protein
MNLVCVQVELKSDSNMSMSMLTSEIESTKDSLIGKTRRYAVLNLFNYYKSNRIRANSERDSLATTSSHSTTSNMATAYVYIDHEKTITLKEIAEERSKQHSRRLEV